MSFRPIFWGVVFWPWSHPFCRKFRREMIELYMLNPISIDTSSQRLVLTDAAPFRVLRAEAQNEFAGFGWRSVSNRPLPSARPGRPRLSIRRPFPCTFHRWDEKLLGSVITLERSVLEVEKSEQVCLLPKLFYFLLFITLNRSDSSSSTSLIY